MLHKITISRLQALRVFNGAGGHVCGSPNTQHMCSEACIQRKHTCAHAKSLEYVLRPPSDCQQQNILVHVIASKAIKLLRLGKSLVCSASASPLQSGANAFWLILQSADDARAAFVDAPNVAVVEIPINDGWARDWGPSVSFTTFVNIDCWACNVASHKKIRTSVICSSKKMLVL